MNINQLNPIQTVNLEQRVGKVEANGTFKEILDSVLDGHLIPIINDNGEIIGGSYNMPATDLIEDNINKIRFERRYCGKPLMTWMLKALELKVNPQVQVYGIKEIVEDGDDVKVVLNNDSEIVVSKAYHYHDYDEDENPYRDADDLPDYILLDDLGVDEDASTREIRRAVKNTYGYFLAKSYDVDENLDWDEDHGCYALNDVEWGRKASQDELD